MNEDALTQAKQLFARLSDIVRSLSDDELEKLVNEHVFETLLLSILDPSTVADYANYAEFFAAKKTRSTIIALLQRAITRSYSFKVEKGLQTSYISPFFLQLFDDGVLFLEGDKPFGGLIGLYSNKELKYGIMARDKRPGEEITRDDLRFVSVDEAQQILSTQAEDLTTAISDLEELLHNKCNDESRYQRYLERYPWALGAKYRYIQNHMKLDDDNIPDFTGVKVNGFRDIIEIKSPFQRISRKNGNFSSEFNQAWNQVERYLDFARENKDYLNREKGFNFENPKCYLIIGFNISDEEQKRIRRKEKMNPAIEVLTYNDLAACVKHTVKFIEDLKKADIKSAS